jgi:hypothetical protein
LPLLAPVMTTTLFLISCVIGAFYFAGAFAAFHLIPQPMLGI